MNYLLTFVKCCNYVGGGCKGIKMVAILLGGGEGGKSKMKQCRSSHCSSVILFSVTLIVKSCSSRKTEAMIIKMGKKLRKRLTFPEALHSLSCSQESLCKPRSDYFWSNWWPSSWAPSGFFTKHHSIFEKTSPNAKLRIPRYIMSTNHKVRESNGENCRGMEDHGKSNFRSESHTMVWPWWLNLLPINLLPFCNTSCIERRLLICVCNTSW